MNRFSNFLNELKIAKYITKDIKNFSKLFFITVFYHLGNKWHFFNSKRYHNICCRCNGSDFTVTFRQIPGDIFTLYEVIGRSVYSFPHHSLGEVKTIVDLGAHIGLTSLYFKSLFPEAQIFSIEPVPGNFKLLKKNCETNGFHWTLISKCIGSENKKVKFSLDALSNQYSLTRNVSKKEGESNFIEIEMITMNDIIREFNINQIDILKVDIEGAEAELFAQCESWISKIRLIIIEVHPTLVDYKKLIENITSKGFHYFKPGTFSSYSDVFLRNDIVDKLNK